MLLFHLLLVTVLRYLQCVTFVVSAIGYCCDVCCWLLLRLCSPPLVTVISPVSCYIGFTHHSLLLWNPAFLLLLSPTISYCYVTHIWLPHGYQSWLLPGHSSPILSYCYVTHPWLPLVPTLVTAGSLLPPMLGHWLLLCHPP